MSAETLRRAAALMRERASATEPGPWWPYERFSYWGVWSAERPKARGRQVGTGRTQESAEHIASWHPAVALAVAAWLEREADEWEGEEPHPHEDPRIFPQFAVARTYLGESA